MRTHYLYSIALFAALAATGCSKDSGIENDIKPVVPDSGQQVVLTGVSNAATTRTGLGDADGNSIPFLWGEGDYIWVNDTKSDAAQEAGRTATFTFGSLSGLAPYEVYYNRTGTTPATASIPAEQTQAAAGVVDLGANGDFGYARTDTEGVFSLNHYTSYIWFNAYSADVTSKLVSITVSTSDGSAIAGEAAFDGEKLGACNGSSTITLSFGEAGVSLPTQGSDQQVFAAMVVYPADLSETVISVIYTFADGSRYLTSKAGKELTAGSTLRLTNAIAAADCVSEGVHYFTPEGWSSELPASFKSVKAITLGDATLTKEDIRAISNKMSGNAIVDLDDTEFATTEFPDIFSRNSSLQDIVLPRNIQTLASSGSYSSAFYNCSGLKKIGLPEGMTALVENAFYGCTKLEQIHIPSTVTEIGRSIFYNCKALTAVALPEGVAEIPQYAFYGCSALASVEIPSTVTTIIGYSFQNCTVLKDITLPKGLTTLGPNAFNGCKALEEVVIPAGITEIDDKTFYQCSNLTSVTLPEGLKTLGDDVFYQCALLQDVTLPASLETIGARTFGGCNSFTKVAINIEEVHEYAYWDCRGLTSIELGDKVKSIGRNAFISNGGNKVASITSHAVTPPVLSANAFGSVGGTVEGKKYVYIPAASFDAYEKAWAELSGTNGYIFEDISNQELTDGVWYRASREEEWTTSMPQSFQALYVRTIGDNATISSEALATIVSKVSAQQAPVTLDLRSAKYAAAEFPAVFAGNDKLGVIKFFDNTTAVAAGAFKGCTALTEAVIPAGVAEIGAETFESCAALAAINMPSGVKTIGDKAFNGCTALADISLGSVKTIGDEAFAASGLTKASVSATAIGERVFADCTSMTSVSLSGMTSIPAGLFSGCVKLAGITVPNSVTEIGANAFDGCSMLASVSLGSGVETVGASAFADCALTSLVLPDQLTTLGDGAFKNNPAIAKITFGAGITAIGDNAFAGNATVERLTVPKTITQIGVGSFADWSKLTTLTIVGNALTTIGSKAFANAVLLADIYAEPTTVPAIVSDSFSGAGTSVQGSKTVHVPDVSAYNSWTSVCSGYTFEALGDDYLSEGVYYRASASDSWSTDVPASFASLFVKTAGDNTLMTSAQATAVAAAVKGLSAPATVDMSEAVYESATFPAVFNGNVNLTAIVLPANVTAVANNAFRGTGFTSVRILANITYGTSAFNSCASLASVTFDEGVQAIAGSMFTGCPLTSVTIPASVTSIGGNAFQNCKSLTSVTLGTGVKTIGGYAFGGCAMLTEMIFPDATETIEQNAFADCVKLAKVSFGKGMSAIKAYSFTGYGTGGCPLLGDITCRSTTPPTLQDDYGTIAFGGSWNVIAGKDAATRVVHLPKSDDPNNGGPGAYEDSSWNKLATAAFNNFQFVYDVE
ncbi:leucine-rich repeat domain-containing protein [uncultured Alistipes sp.]|jgi:hypothetical protein|uniref:leucine-rich repeat domain-containing protein n=1 Tax=uncultured Alistipes sp. TaxID=538949 RepID=UPI0025D148AE|nr:leucine-rich repeat domain-containing protein [uncultured Alistipes sp.]